MVKPLSRLITQLQGVVLERQHAIDALTSEQAQLRMRTMAAALLLQQCSALLELGQALERGRAAAGLGASSSGAGSASAGSASGGSGGDGGDGDGGAAGGDKARAGKPPAPIPRWQESVLLLKSQLEAVSAEVKAEPGAEGDAPPGAPAEACEAPATPAGEAGPGAAPAAGRGGSLSAGPFPLNWEPVEAAEAHVAAGPAADLSTAALRTLLLDYAQTAGTLLPRIEARAPNADHALRVLQRFRTRFLEFMALLAVGECRQHGPDGPGVPAMVGVVMEPLTPPRHDQQIDGGGAAQPPHGEEHWAWALAQARLDPQQEEMVRTLLCVWHERNGAIVGQREALLKLSSEQSGDAASQEELVRDLSALQVAFEVNTAVFAISLYGSLFSAVQTASLLVASWPYAPSLHVLHALLCKRSQPSGGSSGPGAAGEGTSSPERDASGGTSGDAAGSESGLGHMV